MAIDVQSGAAPEGPGLDSADLQVNAPAVAVYWGGSREYWIYQLVGWSFEGYSMATSAILGRNLPRGQTIADVIVLCAMGLACTHLLRLFIQRRGWVTLPVRALIPRCIAASVLVALPLAALMRFLSIANLWGDGLMYADSDRRQVPGLLLELDEFVLPLANLTLLILIWLVLYFGFTLLRQRRLAQLRQAELQSALQMSKLRLLKSQLNPHFLFNSLNCVRALIPDDPVRAQDAITHLARTLRYCLGTDQTELVTLRSELAIAQDYLALEMLRFSDRLRTELDVCPESLESLVPVMLLQTVVENAVTHGIATLPEGGTVRISARVSGGMLHIRVENPRPARKPMGSRGAGTGLRNCRERLQVLFGTRAGIELDLSQQDRALTQITIPQRL
jgi:two-component system, LytTR family, sensor kinase